MVLLCMRALAGTANCFGGVGGSLGEMQMHAESGEVLREGEEENTFFFIFLWMWKKWKINVAHVWWMWQGMAGFVAN